MRSIPYTITSENLTVVVNGCPVLVAKRAANFAMLRTALLTEDWEAAANLMKPADAVARWLRAPFATDLDGRVLCHGAPVPEALVSRIHAMAAANEAPEPLLAFWERLRKNPSYRSTTQLFDFLTHIGIPITTDGCFLAYKSVRSDFQDHHSSSVDNSPGTINEMPRNEISDDADEACHVGFHVGALEYARTFVSGGTIVICKVDPEHVVCVPKDSSFQKMRVCRYEVIGVRGGDLPSTTISDGLPPAAKARKSGARKRKAGATRSKLARMNTAQLMAQPIAALRRYAGRSLKIVRASKLAGGKLALVKRILSARARG